MYSQISNAMICCAHDHCIHRQAICAPRAPLCAPCAPTRPHARSAGGLAIGKARSDDPAGKVSRRPTPLVFAAHALLRKIFDPIFLLRPEFFQP
jgi:hypothetical protein